MRNNGVLSPWTELSRTWNLMDRYWPTREFDLVSAIFPVDMYQQDNQIVVRASVPGVKAEDLKVNLEQNTLTITGETCDTFQEEGNNRMFHREHTYGKFMRSVRLPTNVDEGAIEANCENGILTVMLPLKKPQQPQSRQIPIRGSNTGSKPIEAYADRPGSEAQGGQTNQKDKQPVGASKS